MTAEDAIRWLHHEADRCRGRGAAEAFCLTLPAILAALRLAPMKNGEAAAFSRELSNTLAGLGQNNGRSTGSSSAEPFNGDFRDDPNPSRVGCGGAT